MTHKESAAATKDLSCLLKKPKHSEMLERSPEELHKTPPLGLLKASMPGSSPGASPVVASSGESWSQMEAPDSSKVATQEVGGVSSSTQAFQFIFKVLVCPQRHPDSRARHWKVLRAFFVCLFFF